MTYFTIDSQTFEANQFIVAFLPQVHLSFVFPQQLLVRAAHLTDHLTDLQHKQHYTRAVSNL